MDAFRSALDSLRLNFDGGIPGFSMEYASFSGQRWGVMAEWETRLRVKGRGQAELFRRRGPGDSTNEPPGLYAGQVSDTTLRKFLDVLADSGIQEYRSVAPGPLDPVDRLHIRFGSKVFKFSWGHSYLPVPHAMDTLNTLLIDWSLNACPSAQWNLRLSIEGLECRADRLAGVLILENRGARSIHIVNPASPGLKDPFRLDVRYAQAQEEQEGYTASPPDLRFSRLGFTPLQQLELVEVLPDRPFRSGFLADIGDAAPGNWIGKIDFMHYLPEDTLAGVEVFNGAVFTESFTW